ncbi:unnamed protein product, partial [Adineta steineri]
MSYINPNSIPSVAMGFR